MKPFKKILCPLDFSGVSSYVFKYAKTFAERFDSELVCLHVIPSMTDAYIALMPEISAVGMPDERDLLDQFDEFTGDCSGTYRKVTRFGTPYVEILRYAQGEDFDLIILGAKGHSKLERLFLGSTSEKVARNAELPVLTVHPKQDGLPLRRILVPIDFSPRAFAVLPTVAALAQTFKSEIYLLHVVEVGHHAEYQTQEQNYEYFERVKSQLADQWDLPADFEKIETLKFIRHHFGSAGYGILEFAQDWDVDLIAMATQGRSGLAKVLLGSVTEKVIRIAPYPVLSIRAPQKPNGRLTIRTLQGSMSSTHGPLAGRN